jgi:suppressor for copper-sensitivity B
MSNYLRVILFLLIAVLPGTGAWAAASPWVTTEVGQVRMIAAADRLGNARDALLGLEFALKKGWKIYWRAPGDAGYAPKMDWAGSANLFDMRTLWPLPERFTILGLETIGYKGEITLPLKAALQRPGEDLRLKLNLDFLACSDICVPVVVDLALSIPAGETARLSDEAQIINRFLSRVPGEGQGIQLVNVWRAGPKTLLVEARSDTTFSAPDLFIEGPAGSLFSAPKVELSDRGRMVRLEATAIELPKEGLGEAPITFTIADGQRGLEVAAVPSPGRAAPSREAATLLGMIGLALLGGLILNLMPCVLPVLSLKILGLIGHGGSEHKHVRLDFIASALGILASFLILGLAALALKLSGGAVGWGLQFQEPMFLSFLAALVVLFAANMAGFYEIGIPHWLGGSGRGLGNPHGLAQHFFAGMFATLLATPCSAPFLGTAVGFALAAGPLEIVVIFLCLGLGMAGPYLAVAAWPQIAARMPRPGAWMLTLKRWLALALCGTAIWLLWVIDSQVGGQAALLVLALLLAAALLFYLRQRLDLRALAQDRLTPSHTCDPELNVNPSLNQIDRADSRSKPEPFNGSGFFRSALGWLALALALAAVPAPRLLQQSEASAKTEDTFWKAFDEAAIPKLVAEGKIVFVDVTADWCVTCQVNKRLVLEQETVLSELLKPDVVLMKADWTKPNAAIGAYLAKFGRFGIPFNAVYGPGAPEGVVLPELLSEEAVKQAVRQAKGS